MGLLLFKKPQIDKFLQKWAIFDVFPRKVMHFRELLRRGVLTCDDCTSANST